MWGLLSDISDGATFKGYTLSKDEWKRLLTAHLYGKERLTRTMSISEMNDFILFLEAFAVHNDINLQE
jgi:hypothetical protein